MFIKNFTSKQKVYKRFKKTNQVNFFYQEVNKSKITHQVSSYNFYRGIVENFEYSSIKNNFLSKIYDIDRKKHFYLILIQNLTLGSFVVSNFKVKIKIGNRCSIKNVPTGILISNVELINTSLNFNKKLLARSAGCFCQLIQKSKNICLIKLPSNNYKKISSHNFATIGLLSNPNYKIKNIKKAGRSYWLDKSSKVRGVAKNPVDHPHGGGEGKTSGGRHSVSAWGKIIQK